MRGNVGDEIISMTDSNRILQFVLVWIAVSILCWEQASSFAAQATADKPALEISSYYSPRNRERPIRPRTDFIILHTTESLKKGALRKVYANGETHFFLDRNGHVYRIIRSTKIAFHAGRSMWEGKTNLDNYSIGIEVAGYHNGDITLAQYRALKELLSQLQAIYNIPDERVLTHSMIAYSAPNRWHRKSHRGRKRCGMLFARQSVRRRLELIKQPLYDPDVKAGRLVVGDSYLASVLYGSAREQETAATRFVAADANVISTDRSAWDIAGDEYKSCEMRYVFPNGKELRGDRITDWKRIPAGTRVRLAGSQSENELETVQEIGRDGKSTKDIAGDEYNCKTTIYFLPDGRVKRGDELTESDLQELPEKTSMLVGYIQGGCITGKRSAFDVCGKRWNFPSTFYRFPDGTIKSGNSINENAIPPNTLVFYRN